jgi:Nif-specific regulatory protein
VIGKNSWIRKEDLFLKIGNEEGADEGDRNLKTAINVFKSHFIQKVLEENNWNQTEAAKSLDIQRTYLSRLIKELDIMSIKEH